MPITHHRFQPADLIVVRASTYAGERKGRGLPIPEGPLEKPFRWLTAAWAHRGLADAISVANPDLAVLVTALVEAGEAASTKKVRRAAMAVSSYLFRWQRRATPFGLFAGVATASVGTTIARFGEWHKVLLRADADWLASVLDALEQDRELRNELLVVADNSAVVRGDRIFVACRPPAGQEKPGPIQETSIRRTRVVRSALAAARQPIALGDLTRQLSRDVPADAAKVNTLLHGLIDSGFLITNLRPPMTVSDGLAYVLMTLAETNTRGIPAVEAAKAQLGEVDALLARHNACGTPEAAAHLRTVVRDTMTRVVPAARQPLAADVRLDADIQLPEVVLREATHTAELLLRLSPKPFGQQAWVDYQVRFRNRYGPGALVPILDLVSDSGLGYPAGYLGAERPRPTWRTLTERDVYLSRLIQQALLAGADEIVLAQSDVEALTVGDHTTTVAPSRIELGVTVHSASTQALDRGDFELRITASPRTPTSMIGRFAYLLDPADRERLAQSYRAAAVDEAQVLLVQVSFSPRRVHNRNVAQVDQALPAVVSVAEHPTGEVIDLDDLAVTADADRLYLVRLSTGQRVSPHLPHALDVTVQTPPLARFLAEVAEARSAVFGPFDLGTARTLPYTPRVRCGRTVLSPARWLPNSAGLDSKVGNDAQQWEKAVHDWRRRWRVPARVIVCDGELRLPLDLEQAADRTLFGVRLHRSPHLEVREDGPEEGDGWIGRPAEFVIPMVSTPAPRPLPYMAAPGTTHRPGNSTVVHARLAGNPACFDLLIAAHLPNLTEELTALGVTRWWIRRHRDLARLEAEQHLALLLRLREPDGYAAVAAKLSDFAANLHEQGLPGELTLTTYYEHPARYGHGLAAETAEHVFATDTLAVTAQLRMAEQSGIAVDALTAASMAQLAAGFGPNPATGYERLQRLIDRHHEPVDRQLSDIARTLADPSDNYLQLRSQPGGDEVVMAWTTRDEALRRYHDLLLPQRDPAGVLRTLLHEHHIRALGVDPDRERRTGHLARAAAMRALAAVGSR
ncbi:lantibiotic dehydratase [Actinoplanes missouriensis]|uniref:lantibiotic dehydratase n=1 Tax=Actinoplanes missouriensis TaxID=1866 RepID=UPI0033E57D54